MYTLLTDIKWRCIIYLLDWKIPKRLEETRDVIYNMLIGSKDGVQTNGVKTKIWKAVSCFTYNADYHVNRGNYQIPVTLKKESYSKPLVYNCNKVNRKVSYKYSLELFDWLESEGLASLEKGEVLEWVEREGIQTPLKVKKSSLRPSEELLRVFEGTSLQDRGILKSVLELKDDTGGLVACRLGESQKRLISLLNTYNKYANDTHISLDGVDYYIQCKKVFNGGWDKGGRMYMTGAMVTCELLKRSNRGNIKINGDDTLCYDYKHLHPSIIACKEGYTFPNGFDPYEVVMEGWDKLCLRKVCKLALLIMINSDSYRSCFQALSWEVGRNLPIDEWRRRSLIPERIDYHKLIECVKGNNGYAVSWFFSGRGTELQYIDSLIIDEIISYWNERQVVVLALYDSVRIQQQYIDELEKVMYSGYKTVVGTLDNCKLELED